MVRFCNCIKFIKQWWHAWIKTYGVLPVVFSFIYIHVFSLLKKVKSPKKYKLKIILWVDRSLLVNYKASECMSNYWLHLYFLHFKWLLYMTLKKVYNSKCKHTCMCATVLCQLSFHSNKTDRIMENIQIDGLSIKKALRYVLQSKRKNSGERAFNFLQTAYL